MSSSTTLWRSWTRFLIWGVCVWLLGGVDRSPGASLSRQKRTVQDVMALYGPAAEQRLLPHVQAAGLPYPPEALALLGFKGEKRLEVWGQQAGQWRWIRSYPMLAASGGAGPKLREGDLQVPEGLYRIEALNPNSRFHLSMKVDYPNALDRQQAAHDGREALGGDIFLHGQDVSVGCIALGDTAIEELFVLVVRVGIEHVSVLLAPYDLRQPTAQSPEALPAWVVALYADLRQALRLFPGAPRERYEPTTGGPVPTPRATGSRG